MGDRPGLYVEAIFRGAFPNIPDWDRNGKFSWDGPEEIPFHAYPWI